MKKVSQKCIFCFPRVEQGVAPACARMCPGRVRFVGYKDDQNGPIWKLVEKWKVAIPLHPEFGTEPNIFYVPPIAPPRYDENGNIDESKPRIPDEYLVSLFGPKVLDALATLKAEIERSSTFLMAATRRSARSPWTVRAERRGEMPARNRASHA